MITKKISIPIYFGYLIIVKYEDEEEFGKKYNVDVKNCEAIVLANRTNRRGVSEYLVGLNGNYRTKGSVIAHEAVHLCNNIFKDRGLMLDVTNDEAQAYLTGWLFEQIDDFLIKYKPDERKK